VSDRRAVLIRAAVEGVLDQAVAGRLIRGAGAGVAGIWVQGGKERLRSQFRSFLLSARSLPWLVLVDLNHEAAWAPRLPRGMCFRVVVREIESWLMADAERLAAHLEISEDRIPPNPDQLDDPKSTLLDVVRAHAPNRIRDALLPRPESRRRVGPLYNEVLKEFVLGSGHRWRPDVAAKHSASLRGCLACLKRLIAAKSA
jgi:hypothetical protein